MGFLKRLSIVNLQLLPSASLAVMATIRNLFHVSVEPPAVSPHSLDTHELQLVYHQFWPVGVAPLLQGYPRCVALLDSDTPTAGGVYQAEVEDADICHAEATTMWELTLLTVSDECEE